jgi:hypothetical protein
VSGGRPSRDSSLTSLRRAIEDGCVFIHTSASLYPSTPARPRATRACWSPSRSRWCP